MLDAWTSGSSRPYAVVAGAGPAALAAQRGAATVSLDAGSDHQLELSVDDLAHHLGTTDGPRPR